MFLGIAIKTIVKEMIDDELVKNVISLLQQIQEVDKRLEGGGALALTIEEEMQRIDWGKLSGMTAKEAWRYVVEVVDADLTKPIEGGNGDLGKRGSDIQTSTATLGQEEATNSIYVPLVQQ